MPTNGMLNMVDMHSEEEKNTDQILDKLFYH